MFTKQLLIFGLMSGLSLSAWSHSYTGLLVGTQNTRDGQLQNLHVHTLETGGLSIQGQVRHGTQHHSVRGHVDLLFKDARGRVLSSQKLILFPTAWLNRNRHHAEFAVQLPSTPPDAVELILKHDLSVHD